MRNRLTVPFQHGLSINFPVSASHNEPVNVEYLCLREIAHAWLVSSTAQVINNVTVTTGEGGDKPATSPAPH
jgi:hypothetical protein